MGLLHSGTLNTIDDVCIKAISEKESIISKYLGKLLPNVSVYDDYNQMMNSEDLDLVYITTPSFSHRDAALSCISKKINFFIEKPLTRNLDEAITIVNALKNKNIINAVGYDARFYPTFLKTKELLESKILGKINDIKSSMYVANIFSKSSGWRFKKDKSGGGVLLDLGCHLIDLLHWYFGNVENVIGNLESIYSEVEDSAHVEMIFSQNITAELDTSWSKKDYRMSEINLEIFGEDGNLVVNQDYIDLKINNDPKNSTRIYKQELNDNVPFDVSGTNFVREDMHIVQSVKNNTKPLVDVFEASKTQSVIEAIYDSAKSQKATKVDYIE